MDPRMRFQPEVYQAAISEYKKRFPGADDFLHSPEFRLSSLPDGLR